MARAFRGARPARRVTWLLAWLAMGATPAPAATPEAGAENVYARYQDRVVTVRIEERASGSKAGLGSGFVVDDRGSVITNYHVVSTLVNHPDGYTAQYVVDGQRRGELELLAVDAIHDLALLRGDALPSRALSLAERPPRKGTTMYSLGNPLNLGLSIVEGTYNGLVDGSLYGRIHLTASLNPGMSGGPTVDADGRVVGVNVATAGNQMSFLVPARFVARLLERARSPASAAETDFRAEVRAQLMANQRGYMDRLLREPMTRTDLQRFKVPGKLSDFINCWGDTSHDDDLPYRQVHRHCSGDERIYLSRRHSTGVVRYRHRVYRRREMGAWRFYAMLEEQFSSPGLHLSGGEDEVTRYRCRARRVGDQGVDFKTVLCLRALRQYTGLFDVYFSAVSLNTGDAALHSSLVLGGVSLDNALAFARRFLEAMTWQR